MKKIFNNVLEMIGNTPIIHLASFSQKSERGHQFFAKLESYNPAGSVKDRIALAIITAAEKRGELKPGATIVEATSGNTGLGLAMVALLRGYKTIFVMPEKISEEKRAILRAYGAQVVITPNGLEPDDPRSYLSVSKKIHSMIPGAFYANQYHNPDNPIYHYNHTGPEIWDQMNGDFDVFVAGAGTGGTISGIGKYLKEKKPSIQIVLADPVGSILYDLFYHKKVIDPPQSYKVEGVGEDMLPDNVHFKYMDAVIKVDDPSSFQMTRKILKQEGLCVGPSSALALIAAQEYSQKLTKPSRILVFFPDNGRAYLSKAFNEAWLAENGMEESPGSKLKYADVIKKLNLKPMNPISVEKTFTEALNVLAQNHSTVWPVINSGNLMGIVESKDILNNLKFKRIKLEDKVLHSVIPLQPWVSDSEMVNSQAPEFHKNGEILVCDQNKNVFQIQLSHVAQALNL